MQEFNKGVYDYIIATDESGIHAEADCSDEPDEEGLADNVDDECKLYLSEIWTLLTASQ